MNLTTQQAELIARRIHEVYCKNNPGNRYSMAWESLPDAIRQTNREQAGEFVKYIDLSGLTVDFDEKSDNRIEQLTDEQIETTARRIHEQWVNSKITMGWMFDDARNDEKKMHPMLVSYDKLDEIEKEKDRAIARAILPLVKMAKTNL